MVRTMAELGSHGADGSEQGTLGSRGDDASGTIESLAVRSPGRRPGGREVRVRAGRFACAAGVGGAGVACVVVREGGLPSVLDAS